VLFSQEQPHLYHRHRTHCPSRRVRPDLRATQKLKQVRVLVECVHSSVVILLSTQSPQTRVLQRPSRSRMRSIPVCLLKTCDQPLTSHHRREWTYDGHVISILVDSGRTWYKCGDLAQIWGGSSSRQQQHELMASEMRAVGSSGAKYVTGTAVLHLARAKLDANALTALFEALGSGTNTVIPGPRKNQPCPFTELEQYSKPRRITQLMDQITYHAGAQEKKQPKKRNAPKEGGHAKTRKQRRGQAVVSNDATQLLVGVLNRFPPHDRSNRGPFGREHQGWHPATHHQALCSRHPNDP
jgi:hypothetical protein